MNKVGNQDWKLRLKHGKDKDYKTPEDLADAANLYFEWVENNPMESEEIFCFQGSIIKGNQSKKRPMTLESLCNYLDICVKTFWNYEQDKDYIQVCTRIRQIIDAQQFEGAATGFFNHAIIARKLGLTDNSNVTIKSEQPLFGD